jgi:hypothetical protein
MNSVTMETSSVAMAAIVSVVVKMASRMHWEMVAQPRSSFVTDLPQVPRAQEQWLPWLPVRPWDGHGYAGAGDRKGLLVASCSLRVAR